MDWPLVVERDDGIRPAGQSDECFYCHQKIGWPHERDCVVVKKRIEMRVTSTDGRLTGSWQLDEPHFWDVEMSEFHKNESTWCWSNIMEYRDGMRWDQPDAWKTLESIQTCEGRCLCNHLRAKFARVVDDTPRREIVDHLRKDLPS